MTSENYQRAGNIFDQLRDIPESGRTAALDAACAGNAELHAQVLRLLQADREAAVGSFLERRAIEDAARLLLPDAPQSIVPGTRLGPYEIVALIGSGGMGDVFKARDSRLNRNVAVKISLEQFSERFERESRAVAALNHPNICTLLDVGANYLVMEYIEGPTLAERITPETAAAAIPLAEALPLALQIAEALEAAHEKGIVHRDLKPANIKLTLEGKVKVLDFGLAKVLEPNPASSDVPISPRPAATRTGIILGTAGYMSPEQARGIPADKRADIWSFGVVLFEMLTGQRAFGGETVSDTLAAVLRADPAWAALPPETPPAILRLLRRCLERDRRKRLPDIAMVRLEIDEARLEIDEAQQAPAEAPAAPVPWPWRRWLAWQTALVLALIAALVWWRGSRPAEPGPLVRLNAQIATDLPMVRTNLGGILALSPDGQRLAVTLRGADSKVRIYTRLLSQSQVNPLADTENATSPFFSPDGQWIGFAADGKLKKISVEGGAAVTLCEAPAVRGASWGDDGTIVVALAANSFLSQVASAGGTPVPLTKLLAGERSHRWPQVLPGSQSVLFSKSRTIGTYDDAAIEVVSLKTGVRRTLQPGGYSPRYLATSRNSGYVVYVHESTLFAVPFDLGHLALAGAPVPIVGDISSTAIAGADFDFSLNGTLVYLEGKAGPGGWPMLWLESSGKTHPLAPSPAGYATPRVSPEGKRIAFSLPSGPGSDIWVKDIDRDTQSRLTFLSGLNRSPVWNPDGKSVVFQSDCPAGPGLYWIRSDGTGAPQRLTDGKSSEVPGSFSPDGKTLAFQQSGNGGSTDIFTVILGGDLANPRLGSPKLFLGTPFSEVAPAFSPDGHWLAYSSNESGSYEVYVRPFPGPGGRWQISTEGGYFPVWSGVGGSLLFRTAGGRMMTVDYSTRGDSFVAGKPRLWSPVNVLTLPAVSTYDLAPDGKQLAAVLASTDDREKPLTHLTFFLNFIAELRRRVPGK